MPIINEVGNQSGQNGGVFVVSPMNPFRILRDDSATADNAGAKIVAPAVLIAANQGQRVLGGTTLVLAQDHAISAPTQSVKVQVFGYDWENFLRDADGDNARASIVQLLWPDGSYSMELTVDNADDVQQTVSAGGIRRTASFEIDLKGSSGVLVGIELAQGGTVAYGVIVGKTI